MLGVAGILGQQIAGNLRALAAVQKAFLLAAHGDRAFPVEGMAVCGDTPLAMTAFYKCAAVAAQAASCVDHLYHLRKIENLFVDQT